MSSSSLTLFLHPQPPRLNHLKPHLYSLIPLTSSLSFKPHICFSSNSNSNHDATSEESRWLREEQRWLREEQRWLREEQRWARDRDSLLREIADLKLKIQALELQNPLQAGASSETIANIAGLLQSLKEKNQIAETGSSSRALELEDNQVKEVFAVSEVRKEKKTKEALRKGSEGEHVRAMQEALLKSGFYSGEEDMEFSNFSSGTERAVKTWQASIGLPEDGIMTEELLERLFDPQTEGAVETKEDANGAAGENRWEEPSRLNKKKGSESNTTGTTTQCLTCRGEGRLLCTECDGTGEPNIEEQFLEWIDEGAKCPYCEGLGFSACDVCGGK
ncbi:protein disulfide isomerase pTAC5, chloroplastic [Rosa sericea]